MTIVYRPKKKKSRFKYEYIYGDCLEAAGLKIPNRAIAIIDQGAALRIGDFVHCSRVTGEIGGYIKQIKEINGDSIIVGTAYIDSTKDYTFEAAEIYGVVTEAYDKVWHDRIYKRR